MDELDSPIISKPGLHDKNDDAEEESEPIPTATDAWHSLDILRKTINLRCGYIECHQQFYKFAKMSGKLIVENSGFFQNCLIKVLEYSFIFIYHIYNFQ